MEKKLSGYYSDCHFFRERDAQQKSQPHSPADNILILLLHYIWGKRCRGD